MAHIQEFYGALDQLYTSPREPRSQSQSQLFYDIDSSAVARPEPSMAQPLLVSTSRNR